jgi:von Willebrand factor type A domain
MRLKTYALLFTLLSALPAQAATQMPHQRVEVAFVLDTTGSMGDLIDGAKRKIWSIATTIVETNPDAEIAMALVAYRDRGDTYVVRTTPLSEDIQGLYGKLVQLQADGGDDTPESVNEALNKAVTGLHWSSGDDVKRIVFLVGDAPPHMDYKQEKQYPAILKTAVSNGIVVNAVQAGDMAETTPIWKEIAQFGHGRYIAIPQDGGEVVVIITPYDDDILHMQRELDESVVPYGSLQKKTEMDSKIKERAAAPAATQLDNSKYYSKRAAKEVVTGGGDLIADYDNKNISLDRVADAELPAELAAKPKADRQAWIEEKLANRKVLETKMAALIAKRDAFVLEEKSKTGRQAATDSFDQAVEETLKVQLN